MRRIHNWTAEEIEFMRTYVSSHTWAETTDAFNKEYGCDMCVDAVKGAGERHGIHTGRDGRYRKGNVPANKGRPRPATGRSVETQFKAGSRPQTWKEVGTESIRCNKKRGQQYIYVKVAEPNVWRMKHILEWEKHNGEVPSGKIIIFADGNTLNTDIGNLVMVSRQQHAVMNRYGIRGCNKEYMETAAKIAEIKVKAAERKKKVRKEEKRGHGTDG